MDIIQLQNINHQFNERILFKNLNMSIKNNSKIALIGKNGVGKSTLLKIIINELNPTNGNIIKKENLKIGYLAQNTGLNSNKTIYEELKESFISLINLEKNIHVIEEEIAAQSQNNNSWKYQNLLKKYDMMTTTFKNKKGYEYKNKIKSTLKGLGFSENDFKRTINSLSGGQKTRLALAKILLIENDLLILDEPTNHLDIPTLNWLESYLKSYQKSLLIVSHDRYFLDAVSNEVYEIYRFKLQHYVGNYSSYIKQKKLIDKTYEKEYKKQTKKIKKLQTFVNKNITRSSTTKRAQSKKKQLSKIKVLEKPKDSKKININFTFKDNGGNNILQLNNAAIGYNNIIIANNININLKKGQFIAVIGKNGIGKSTFLKSIIGQIPFIKGNYNISKNIKISYYDQEQKMLNPNKTILQEIWDEHPNMSETDIRALLGNFLFSGNDVNKKIYNLSGGEKATLMLAKISMNKGNFLVLDEPTNHLDIKNKEILEEALLNFNGTILFASHDRYFINKIANGILEIKEHNSKLYLGNYDYYISKKDIEDQQFYEDKNTYKKTISKDELFFNKNKNHKKDIRKLQRNINEKENKINQLENEAEYIEKKMTDPKNFKNIKKMNQLNKKFKIIKDNILNLEEEWEQESIKLEELANK